MDTAKRLSKSSLTKSLFWFFKKTFYEKEAGFENTVALFKYMIHVNGVVATSLANFFALLLLDDSSNF